MRFVSMANMDVLAVLLRSTVLQLYATSKQIRTTRECNDNML